MTRLKLPRSRRSDPLEGWGTYLGSALVAGLGILGYLFSDLNSYEAGAWVAAAFGMTRIRAAIGRESR
jgi:hypothetical protein